MIVPLLLPALLAACVGAEIDDSTVASASCGDADGPDGTDTGDSPDLLGAWSSQFGQDYYDDNCTATDLDRDTESWIGAFYVQGTAPDSLYVYFGPQGSPVTDRFWGAMDAYGGLTFTGTYAHSAGTLHAAFSGLPYADPNDNGRIVIRGNAFLGLDADGDQAIDCYARATWNAFKSG